MQDQDAPDLLRQVQQTLQDDQAPATTEPDLAALRAYLQARIEHMLGHDMGRLVAIMYRLDVPEKSFDEAMRLPADRRAAVLAELVLARENQRLIFRRQYSNRNPNA